MKQSVRNILLVFSGLILISGCKKHDYTAVSQEVILFQYDYSSSSEHSGFLIDSEGNVYTYSNPSEWNHPDSDMEISREQAEENTGSSVFSGIKIPGEELLKYAKAIDFIASSRVTAPRKNSAGEGSTRFICYQFDESAQKYKGYLIKSEGEVSRENLNFHSKRVSQWMKDIGSSVKPE